MNDTYTVYKGHKKNTPRFDRRAQWGFVIFAPLEVWRHIFPNTTWIEVQNVKSYFTKHGCEEISKM